MKCSLVGVSYLLFFVPLVHASGSVFSRLSGQTLQILNAEADTSWRTYCHYNSPSSTSNTKTFNVACRSLGYEGLSSFYRVSYTSPVSTAYPQYTILCEGHESSLADCDISYNSYSTCRYYYTVFCAPCSTGSSRLTGGLVPYHGHVEVCLNGRWSRVCSTGWGTRDAVVVCRQLNFPYSQLSYKFTSTYELNNVGYLTSDRGYNCFGNESRLIDCKYSTYSYCLTSRSYSSPTVLCKGEAENRCNAGSIRLYGGEDEYGGNLQMCVNETWTNAINYFWNYWDAEVACQQLRLFQYGSTKVTWQYVSSQSAAQPTSHLGFDCSQSHRRLQDCPYYVTYYNYLTVYLRCQPLSLSRVSCDNGQLRLMGGSSSNEGRVEICWEGVWGSICRNSWHGQETAIACEQLGFQSENSSYLNPIYGDGDVPILFSSLDCIKEDNLLQCRRQNSYIGYHTCSTLNNVAATIRCDASTCNHGDVRLFGGYISWEGIPQVCINGQWVTGCSTGWDLTDSTTFCRQLLHTTNIRVIQNTAGGLRQYPVSRKTISYVACSTISLSPVFTRDCFYTVNNISCSRIYVGCYERSNCVTGTVRLASMSSANDGVVEVCDDGFWKSITSSLWDYRDARVVCRQLNRPWERAIASTDTRRSAFFRHRANCLGTENNILSCSFSTFLTFETSMRSYYYYSAAAVICRGNSTSTSSFCEQGDVRLVNSTQTSEVMQGTVQVCDNGIWTGVCYSTGWGEVHTKLACTKLLGHTPKSYWSYTSEKYNNVDNVMTSLSCPSTAQILSSCSPRYTERLCYTNSLVGISCQDVKYNVKVNSVKEERSFKIGEQALFYCNLEPDLISLEEIVPLSYRWSVNGEFFSSQQNFSLNMPLHFMKSNIVYCEISARNYMVGRGHSFFEIEDVLDKNQLNPFNIRNGSVYLNALVNSTAFYGVMSELVWYYNNYPIARNTTVLAEEVSLVTTAYGSSGYKARFEGFLTIPHDEQCEEALLDELHNYPAFSSAHFPKDLFKDNSKLSLFTNAESRTYVQYTSNERILMTVTVDLSLVPKQYFTKSYALGIFNNKNLRFFYQLLGDEILWTHTVELTEGQFTDAGVYEVFLYWTYSSEFQSNCSSYYSLMINAPISISSIVVEKSNVSLCYYEKKNHTFSATKYQFFVTESSVLECRGSIDVPDFSTIYIRKGNLMLNDSQTGQVKVMVNSKSAANSYGVYHCVMNAEGMEFTESVYLQDRVNIEVQLKFEEAMESCEENQGFIDLMVQDMANLMKEMCECNISPLNFENTRIRCPNDKDISGIINSTLAYSSESGNQTASRIVEMLFTETSLSFNTLALRSNIIIEEVSFYNGSAIRSTAMDDSQNNGLFSTAMIVVAIISFVAGIMVCIGVVAITYCVRYRRKTKYHIQAAAPHLNVNTTEAKYGIHSSKTQAPETVELPEYDRPHPINIPPISRHGKDLQHIEQPLYEPIEVTHQNITMSPNVGYGHATLSKI